MDAKASQSYEASIAVDTSGMNDRWNRLESDDISALDAINDPTDMADEDEEDQKTEVKKNRKRQRENEEEKVAMEEEDVIVDDSWGGEWEG